MASGATTEPWAKATTVGFITVGANTDEGYNEAVYSASLKVASDLHVKVLRAANVPETQQVTTVMQQMVDDGAKIIFATSYGYQSYAYAFAKSHRLMAKLSSTSLARARFTQPILI